MNGTLERIAARRDLDARVLALRSQGLGWTAIGRELGYAENRVHAVMVLHANALRRAVRTADHEAARVPVDPYFAAWAAGFFDGEGCISASVATDRAGRHRVAFAIYVTQAVEEPIALLQNQYGGSVTRKLPTNPRHHLQWRWRAGTAEGEAFLHDVLPYLHVKHEAARLALDLLTLIHRQGHRVSEEQHGARRDLAVRIQQYAHKGRKPRRVA